MKQLLRLYPKRWRRRYGAEVADLVDRGRPSLAGVVDLLRGALDARLRRSAGLVFVPRLGFRPAGTRVLADATTTEQDGTTLRVVATAASLEGIDVLVQWDRPSDAVDCAPGAYLSARPAEPPALGSAQLRFEGTSLDATSITRGAYETGVYGIHALHTIHFAAIPPQRLEVELRVRDGSSEFALPLRLAPAPTRARIIDAVAEHGGVTVRAIGVAWHADELVIDLDVRAASSVGQVGTPMPPQPEFGAVSEEVRRKRAAELRRVFGDRVEPLRLESPSGQRIEEVRRIFTLDPGSRQEPIVQRFAVAFPAPLDAREVTLVVPFVELSDHSASAQVDLGTLPTTATIGAHAFTVLSAEPYGEEMRVYLQLAAGVGERVFVQPASFSGAGGSYSWNREGDGRVWFAGRVGDPPLVRFIGTVERVPGPWRVRIPLAS